MEYFIGSAITIITVLVFATIFKKNITEKPKSFFVHTQSYLHELLRPVTPTNKQLKDIYAKKTQAVKHRNNNLIRVLFLRDNAYWIQNNTFYTAKIFDGEVDKDTTTQVDIMGMDKVQLDDMSFIVEMLTEGVADENGSSR